MAIILPPQEIQGRPITDPTSPDYGNILFKYPSGSTEVDPGPGPDPEPSGPGAPNWIDNEFVGTPQTKVTSYEEIQAPTQAVYYVDSVNGNDSNSGTSPANAFKTITKAITTHVGGDHIYLKRGGRWRERLHPLSGGPYLQSGPSPEKMTVISFYGDSGPRPIIEYSGEVITTYNRGGLKNLALDGIHFYGYRQDPSHPEFIGSARGADLRFYGNDAENVLLQDLLVDHSEITIQRNSKDSIPGIPKNFRLINPIFTGRYANHTSYTDSGKPSSLFVEPLQGLTVKGAVMDFGGWHPTVQDAGANQFCHNVYLVASDDPTVGNSYFWENCIISRGSSHGIHGRPGGTYKNISLHRNAVGLQIGYSKTAMGAGTVPLVEDCVVSECYSMWKGNDVTPVDAGRGLRTGAKWGINFENYGGAQITAKNNICQIGYVAGDDRPPSTHTVGFRKLDGELHHEEGTIVYMFPNQTGSYPDPGRTLADYDAYLNGTGSYDSFMSTVKSRPLRAYDFRYTGEAVNNFIREGYGR